MYTANLPRYAALPAEQYYIPSYTPVPRAHELRLALNNRNRSRPTGEFVKQTRKGNVSLRLLRQDDNASLPIYGCGSSIEGAIDILRTDGIASVEVKMEGTLMLQEVAEGGMSTHKLCLTRSVLWVKDRSQDVPCPHSLRFSLALPSTFTDGDKIYPLPPTYESHLSGLPGFRASIDYTVSALVVKPNLMPSLGKWSVSTSLLYRPRSRPSRSLPRPLIPSDVNHGFPCQTGWKVFSSLVKARTNGVQDIVSNLYLPSCRVFAITQPIPFHLTFNSSETSLAAFLPYGPVSMFSRKKNYTQIQLFRQTTVDVRNTIVLGAKADIWRVDCIGGGMFRHAGDGSDWISFSGEIFIREDVEIGGFKAGGFSLKDCIVLSMTPPDVLKSPFYDFRQVIPIRLTTDRWSDDGTGAQIYNTVFQTQNSSDELDNLPSIDYSRYIPRPSNDVPNT